MDEDTAIDSIWEALLPCASLPPDCTEQIERSASQNEITGTADALSNADDAVRQPGDVPSSSEDVASKQVVCDNLYVKIQSRLISRLSVEHPEGMKAAVEGLFQKWDLQSQPTCLVVPTVFSNNLIAELFVLFKSKDDKMKALKLTDACGREFFIKDVTLEREIKKSIGDEEALDKLLPLRHTSLADQRAYKHKVVQDAAQTVSFDQIMEHQMHVSPKKFPGLFDKRLHPPPKIHKLDCLSFASGQLSVAVKVYLENSENGEIVAGIRSTHADGSYSFIPIDKCQHVSDQIVELTQRFVKFMNENKEVEPYDHSKKWGLICWLELTKLKNREHTLMTLALPYCSTSGELLPVDELLNTTSLKSMIEAAQMTECLGPPDLLGPCDDYKNTLRVGSLAESAPDISDFDFKQADFQLAAVKPYMDKFLATTEDSVSTFAVDFTWHHVLPCPVEWNRSRSKLIFHHSGPVRSTNDSLAANFVLDFRCRPGHSPLDNWDRLLSGLRTTAKLPQTHLATTTQHASVIRHLVQECQFLTICDMDVNKSTLNVLEEENKKRTFLMDPSYCTPVDFDKAVEKAGSEIDSLIVWVKDDDFLVKDAPCRLQEELVRRGLKTMFVVIEKLEVSPEPKNKKFQEELKNIIRRSFPRMVLTVIHPIECAIGDHFISVILKFERNKALQEKGLDLKAADEYQLTLLKTFLPEEGQQTAQQLKKRRKKLKQRERARQSQQCTDSLQPSGTPQTNPILSPQSDAAQSNTDLSGPSLPKSAKQAGSQSVADGASSAEARQLRNRRKKQRQRERARQSQQYTDSWQQPDGSQANTDLWQPSDAPQSPSTKRAAYLKTMKEIANTRTHLQKLVRSLNSSGISPGSEDDFAQDDSSLTYGIPRASSSRSQGMPPFGRAIHPDMPSPGGAFQRGMSSYGGAFHPEEATNSAPRRPPWPARRPPPPSLLSSGIPIAYRKLAYNARADWREDTWLLPGTSRGERERMPYESRGPYPSHYGGHRYGY